MIASGSNNSDSEHGKRPPRISKEDMFAFLALWMEKDPEKAWNLRETEEESKHEPPRKKLKEGESGETQSNNVGAVFVSPHSRIIAMDRTNGKVHGAVRGLIACQDKVRGCTVYLSRQPCSFCVKLLAQAEVARVRFLPLEPEMPAIEEMEGEINRITTLCKVCPIGLSLYVPKVGKDVIEETARKRSKVALEVEKQMREDKKTTKATVATKLDVTKFRRALEKEFWPDRWVNQLPVMAPKLGWTGMDSNFQETLKQEMLEAIEWLADATYSYVPNEVSFGIWPLDKERDEDPERPNPNNPEWQNLARYMFRMAQIAARRTDDPSTGVGAVIVTERNKIASVGVNGYPSHTMYGDFPRAKGEDVKSELTKYPYLIHAEQNALLLRNTRSMDHPSTTLFSTRVCCDDCAELVADAGIKNIVVPPLEEKSKKGKIGYERLAELAKSSSINVFTIQPKNRSTLSPATRSLRLDSVQAETTFPPKK